MREEDYHNKKWGVEDFERYHSGKMPDLEMHALEKAALEDPFLEDALEGYAYTKTAISDIEELRNKLRSTQEGTKIIWYRQKGISQFLKIAAILILFLGFARLLNNNNREEKKDEIASVPTITTTIDKASPQSAVPVSTEITSVPEADKADKRLLNERLASMKKQKIREPKLEEGVAMAPGNTVQDSQAQKEMASVENIQLSSKQKSLAAPSIITQPLEGKLEGLVVGNQNAIRGRVVDNAGNPVAFANINDRENNLMQAADKDGYFSLNNMRNATNVKVDVNAIGFETNKVALSAGNTENKIVLKESNQALSEVVVTGYGSKKKSAVTGSSQKFEKDNYGKQNNIVTLVNALPAAGWDHFNRFINDSLQNKKLPASGYQEVILFFNINSRGKAQDISIKKSVSDSLDTTAKQILLSIPALKKIKQSKKAEAIIRL